MLDLVVFEIRFEIWEVIFVECYILVYLFSYNEKFFNNEDMFYFNDILGNEI